MFGVPIPPHVYVTVPRVLADLIVGRDDQEAETAVPEATADAISCWLRDWPDRTGAAVPTWPDPAERFKVARRLRFARWLLRHGRLTDAPRSAGLDAPLPAPASPGQPAAGGAR